MGSRTWGGPVTAGVWKDDAQVVDLHTSKHYPSPELGQHVPGVRITVRRVTDSAAPALL
jgi:Holliday junction resolvase RusA-like endonuclease